MRELSLHLLDIIENSISAQSKQITVEIIEDSIKDRLYMSIRDDGKGMDAETVAKVIDPFVTSRKTRKVGLGIPLFKEAAEACNGYLKIQSIPGEGTFVEVEFQRSHIDRAPLGNLVDTFTTVIIGSPQIHWVIIYKNNNETFIFDDKPIKDILQDTPLSNPDVIKYIRDSLNEGIYQNQPV